MNHCDRFCSQCGERKTCDKPLEAYVSYCEFDIEFKIVFLGWRNRNKAKYAAWRKLRAVDPLFTDSFIEWARSVVMSIQHTDPSWYGSGYFMDLRRKDGAE